MFQGFAKRAAGFAAMLGVGGVCLFGAVAAAQVPDPFSRQLAQQLARAEEFLGQRGYSRAAGPFAGALGAGESRRFQVTLRAGQDYQIVGVCDDRCGDLDMRLYDPNLQVLRADTLDDRIPLLDARVRATGVHFVEVSMYQCTDAPCYFAFNVYAR
jgi:hypothetical protein